MINLSCFDDTTPSIALRIYTDMPIQWLTLPSRPDINLIILVFRCVTLPDHSYIYSASLKTDQAVFKLKYWILFDLLIPYCLYSEACNRCEDLNLTFKAFLPRFTWFTRKGIGSSQITIKVHEWRGQTCDNGPQTKTWNPITKFKLRLDFTELLPPPDSSKGSEGTSFHHQRHFQENNT